MSWHAGDFHFVLQIAPFHNKNTMHIRLDMLGGKTEMFILAAFDLRQSKKRSRMRTITTGRRAQGSPWGPWCGCRAGGLAMGMRQRAGSQAPSRAPTSPADRPQVPAALSGAAQKVWARQGWLWNISSLAHRWTQLASLSSVVFWGEEDSWWGVPSVAPVKPVRPACPAQQGRAAHSIWQFLQTFVVSF